MKNPHQLVIFTDLDGTLLSETDYDPGPAKSVLDLCRKARIPVVFCSSKTAAEITVLREALKNPDPFICENGGAVYIPVGVFPRLKAPVKREGDFEIIEIGTPVARLRAALMEAASKAGAVVRGMGEMSVEEVCSLTGLDAEGAELAMRRQYDEPFILVSGDPNSLGEKIAAAGFTMTRGGRFFHILGGSDKGKAVRVLADLYREQFGPVTTVGLGDAENDLPMFKAVDRAYLVQKPTGIWAPLPDLLNLTRVKGIGPEGWAKAVKPLLDAPV